MLQLDILLTNSDEHTSDVFRFCGASRDAAAQTRIVIAQSRALLVEVDKALAKHNEPLFKTIYWATADRH